MGRKKTKKISATWAKACRAGLITMKETMFYFNRRDYRFFDTVADLSKQLV